MRLSKRRILVTGAGSGIGAGVAELFHSEGARLALMDIQGDALKGTADRLDGVFALRCDVSDADEVSAAVSQAVRSLGGLDGVVNVAGIDLIRDFASMTPSEWRKVQAVNVDGAMYVCKAALPALIAHGSGTIVNVASGAALRPLANRTAYCASKAALVMFTKALALELAPLGIRANALCPGVIDTPMVRVSYENATDPEAALREILSRPALARLGTVEEVANAALYLTGDESSYTTGSALVVDGGRAFH
jgi:NAD(P)-dependent dehydrogenase (short-subunit alcohol dehydrogenase family)